MNAPANIQVIRDAAGNPAFVVIPYADYVSMAGHTPIIPNEVVGKVVKDGMSIIQAWREYLGLTQAEVAQRLGISQPAYAKQESSDRLRKSTREKIAKALGIEASQLE